MRKDLSFAVAAAVLLFLPASGFAYQQNQSPQNQQQSTAQPASSAQSAAQTPQAVPAQKDSLAAAARRAREEKKEQPKAKVFTNDNLPTVGGISSVGEAPAAGENAVGDGKAPAAGAAAGNDEKAWRTKFATLRHKLEQDQQDLDVMQRELEVLNVQYYDNPVKAMQQDLTREDINKKTSAIDAKKQQIEADKQAISDAEDDLRKAGGDIGWAR
jgi:outer membrane lipopolysaccharide assembly protein LptE/RlpB